MSREADFDVFVVGFPPPTFRILPFMEGPPNRELAVACTPIISVQWPRVPRRTPGTAINTYGEVGAAKWAQQAAV